MTDIDFDELDKAVNSLVAQSKNGEGNKKAPKPETPPTIPAASEPDKTAAPVPAPVSKPRPVPQIPKKPIAIVQTGRPTPRLTARPASKSVSGSRVIDIMAPKKPIHAAATASRVAPTVLPSAKKAPVMPAPAVAPVATPMPQPVAENQSIDLHPEEDPNHHALNVVQEEERKAPRDTFKPTPDDLIKEKTIPVDEQWPDPLNFSDQAALEPTDRGAFASPMPREPQTMDQPDTTLANLSSPSGSSPFLPDTKVEKRPLGAFAAQASAITPPEPTKSIIEEAATPETTELDEVQPLEFESTSPNKVPKAEAPATEATSQAESLPSAMLSIPKQYKTPAQSLDNTQRPIFDTKEYHPPLLEAETTAREGGSWGKILFIILIIAILGVAAYFGFQYFTSTST